MLETIIDLYQQKFGNPTDLRTFFSPGRVNLIGEHIDYNGGHVFPCAISLGNYGAIDLRNDRKISLYSHNFPNIGVIEIDLDNLDYRSEHAWANYAKGIIKEFLRRNLRVHRGFNIVIYGNLLTGAGLSSSASIELLVATMLNKVFNLKLTPTDLALLGKQVENEYMHVNCGIMDQFVIANGKKNHAMLLNTETLEYSEVLLNLGEYDVVICNSMKKRGLVTSAYNTRKSECERALSILNEYIPARSLCDISYPDFERLQDKLEDPTLIKRVRHVITENLRTMNAHDQLMLGDISAFGESLLASHYSLKTDYEVSCVELDDLVEIAMNNGSIGSRMTGAGFGGCTVNIVKHSEFEDFKLKVQMAYNEIYGVVPDILIANPVDGTKEIFR
ncbi:MAG: galactokinase [Bacilli bacterium]|nr:galactokinase [Bacilli bacterium]MBN2695933.1 galactokinase [Bacilli bacterium]